jgi:hypothetical protein
MSERQFRLIELGISLDEFHRLPRNPAYKYEYFEGRAVLSPRPKYHNAVLDLSAFAADGAGPAVTVQPLRKREIPKLAPLFRAAFERVQPIASLDEREALQAARDSLKKTATGGDGLVVEAACFKAFDRHFTDPAGVILITLLDRGEDGEARFWHGPPPADAVARGLGVPHLTWVFVSPWVARHGMGSALLAASVRALLGLGYQELASTFLLGNESSTLWHWRNGFRLRPLFGPLPRRPAAPASPAPPGTGRGEEA